MSRWTLLITLIFAAACSGQPGGFQGDDGTGDSGTGDDGSASNDSGTTGNDAGTTSDAAKQDASTSHDSGPPPMDSGGPPPPTVDNSDGFGSARAACIQEINKLRTGAGHAAYTIWDDTSTDKCVDEQATYDQKANSAHDAWINSVYPTCNGNAQDECLGYGNSPSEVIACLDSMWDERLQPNCSSCDSCNSTTLSTSVMDCQNTKTCDFYGTYGSECGHYCNMSADYFSYAACGFSTVGTSSDWAVQNFK